MNRRRDRVLLPGWWRFLEQGPQWSPTARQRIGVPTSEQGELGDWQRWEAELRQDSANPAIEEGR